MNRFKELKKALRQALPPAPDEASAPGAQAPSASAEDKPWKRQVAAAVAAAGLTGADGQPLKPAQALKALKAGQAGRGGMAAGGKNGKGLGLKALKGTGAAGLIAAALGGGTAVAAPPPAFVPATPPGGATEETVVYKQTAKGPLEMHVFVPTTPVPAGGRPCMVFFHGGSWKRGSSNQFRAFSAMLAQHGIVGMSAEYRLLDGDERQIPYEPMQDARSAMRWVRHNAARFGCDLNRIGAGGGSAGAHLALMTAFNAPGIDDPKDNLSIDPRPAALICFNGPTNFDDFESAVPVAERRKYSPFWLVDKSLPPTLLLHGTNDRVVPYKSVVAFRDKAVQLGAHDVRLVTFDGRGHGFFNKGKGQPGDWERSASEMLTFLHGIGWA